MAHRRRYDLFEPWPDDDDDELAAVTTTTRSVMIVVVALVVFVVTLVAVIALIRAADWFDDEHRRPLPSQGAPAAGVIVRHV